MHKDRDRDIYIYIYGCLSLLSLYLYRHLYQCPHKYTITYTMDNWDNCTDVSIFFHDFTIIDFQFRKFSNISTNRFFSNAHIFR